MFFSNKLKKISNLNHCFFSRKNGVSKGIYSSLNCGLGSEDNKENVIQNINIVRKKLNFENNSIISLRQNHSNKVVYFSDYNQISDKISGDAIVTNLKNIGIAVLTADCVPILIAEPKKKIIGCIHAGWKGAFSGIIENTLDTFLKLNANLNDLIVAVGPCIDQKNYEVDTNFYKKFINNDKNNMKFFANLNQKKHLFDIRGYVSSKLHVFGIKNIEHLKIDTFDNEENFFSYRRSKRNKEKDYGRCISVILMT